MREATPPAKQVTEAPMETFDAMKALTVEVGEAGLALIKKGFRERIFSVGKKISRQGEFQDFVYILKSGRVRVSRASGHGQDSTVAILGPGDEVGMSSLFSETSGVSCVALDELSVEYFTRDTLLFLMQSVPGLASNVVRILSRRIEQLEERISYCYFDGPLIHRLSIALLNLSDEGTVAGDRVQLPGIVTHEFLASLVCASREAVTLALGKLGKSGAIVQIGRGTLAVRPVMLNRIVGLQIKQ